MKNYLAISAVAAALVSVLATGGCVPTPQYNEALALNSKMQLKLEEANKRILILEDEKGTMEASLADRETQAAARQKEIDNLNQANTGLQGTLDAVLAKYKVQGEELERLRKYRGAALPKPVDEALSALAAANPDLIEYLPKYGMLKIKSDLSFASGSTKVQPAAIAALKKLAEILNSPTAAKFHLYVAGHTDDQPLLRTKAKYGTNWGLSAYRAIAVIEALFAAGVEQPRMAAVAFSKHHPIAPNKPGNKGNALNRRVELWLVPPDRLLTQQAPEGAAVPEKTEGTEEK